MKTEGSEKEEWHRREHEEKIKIRVAERLATENWVNRNEGLTERLKRIDERWQSLGWTANVIEKLNELKKKGK